MKIASITAREILDSRGNPTVEAKVTLANGMSALAKVPSGASTGVHEALELRDEDKKRYNGKGVLLAVKNVNTTIASNLKGMEIESQRAIDEKMIALDGTPNKSKLGANAILAVSLAAARAGALNACVPLYQYLRMAFHLDYPDFRLPTPTMNILNGGRHANNGLSIQEFMVIPKHALFKERVRMGVEVFQALKTILSKKGFSTAVGDEGGFAPVLKGNEDALKLIMLAIKTAGYTLGKQISLGLDLAASEFFDKDKYYFKDKKTASNAKQMIDTLKKWLVKYPLISIEDALAEDDWDNWQLLTKELGKKAVLVGDDLFVTNSTRLQEGIEKKVGNAILIKVNQIGSLSETIDTILLAQKNKYKVSVSHRSGETADTFIADLAVAVNADFIKTGSLSRSERVEKYNRLMEIEDELMNPVSAKPKKTGSKFLSLFF